MSSRGNFYLTFTPGDEFWVPHNRVTSRRITSMGFVRDKISLTQTLTLTRTLTLTLTRCATRSP